MYGSQISRELILLLGSTLGRKQTKNLCGISKKREYACWSAQAHEITVLRGTEFEQAVQMSTKDTLVIICVVIQQLAEGTPFLPTKNRWNCIKPCHGGGEWGRSPKHNNTWISYQPAGQALRIKIMLSHRQCKNTIFLANLSFWLEIYNQLKSMSN